MKIIIDNFRRCAIKEKKRYAMTVNLRPENKVKLDGLDIFLSKLVNAFLDAHDKKTLEQNFPLSQIVSSNGKSKRVVTSISIRADNMVKIENVNVSALVNNLIESI
jgi:ribosomal protein L31E